MFKSIHHVSPNLKLLHTYIHIHTTTTFPAKPNTEDVWRWQRNVCTTQAVNVMSWPTNVISGTHCKTP